MPTHTVESRALDWKYDPVLTTPYTAYVEPTAGAAVIIQNERHKYFRRPVVPHLDAIAPEVLLAPVTDSAGNEPMMAPPEPPTKTVGVQTKYRDSDAQTDPYEPPHVVTEGDSPEVLMLASLKFGAGLPVGRREIEMVEQARAKRALEAALPPTTDAASLALRRRMMEAQEMREFQMRQAEVDRTHAARLQVLERALKDRDAGNEFLAEQRIEALRQRKLEARDKAVSAIQARRIKVLRKLAKARADAGARATGGVAPVKAGAKAAAAAKRDIIGEYADFASKSYAPMTRVGQHPDKDSVNFNVAQQIPGMTNDAAHVTKLQETMSAKLTQTRIERPRDILEPKALNGMDRRKWQLTTDLEKMDAIIKAQKLQLKTESAEAGAAQGALGGGGGGGADGGAELPTWRTRAAKTERPATPSVPAAPADPAFGLGAALLQRLLRGRSVQNRMYEGKQMRMELIRELRAVDAAEAEDADAAEAADARRSSVVSAALHAVSGEAVSSLLDFLAKELARKHEMERLRAVAATADTVRRRREAEESGRRQAEEQLRSSGDEVYRQVVKVNQSAASTFVDELVAESVQRLGSARAMDELRATDEVKGALLPPAEGGGAVSGGAGFGGGGGIDDEVIRDLVVSVIGTAVQRLATEKRVEEDDKPALDAAQKAAADVLEVAHQPAAAAV